MEGLVQADKDLKEDSQSTEVTDCICLLLVMFMRAGIICICLIAIIVVEITDMSSLTSGDYNNHCNSKLKTKVHVNTSVGKKCQCQP